MKKIFTVFVALMAAFSAFAQKDKFAGFYEAKSGDKPIFAEVFRSFDNTYRIRIYPEIMVKNPNVLCEVEALKENNGSIQAKVDGKLNVNITPDEITGEFDSKKLSFKRIEVVAPTMGAKPPAGAVVLFDGKDLSKWNMGKRDINWIIADGAATIDNANKSASIFTNDTFGAMKFHLEFTTPTQHYNEEKQQRRGNSGIKFGPYEIQILDTFGTTECNVYDVGSIYSIVPPAINAALEPGAWQVYDIDFTPVKYDASGNVVSLPRFTVYLNGILVQDDVEVPTPTNAKMKKDTSFKHPEKIEIQLQNHQHDNSFRNIWLVEVK